MKKLFLLCCLSLFAFVPQNAEAQFGWLADGLEYLADGTVACVTTVGEVVGATAQSAFDVAVVGVVTVGSAGTVWICDGTREMCCSVIEDAGDAWVQAGGDIADDWRQVGPSPAPAPSPSGKK